LGYFLPGIVELPAQAATFLNCEPGGARPESTIIISGPPRSGTSMISAMAKAAGLWIGDLKQRAVFEDQDIAYTVERDQRPLSQIAIALRNLRRPGLALRGVDVRQLKAKIALRNARFQKWGFKRPNVVPILGRSGFGLFRNPRLIMILRDPAAVAERIALADRKSVKSSLKTASKALNANLVALHRLKIPIMLISYEKARAAPESLFAEICDYCGLVVPPDGYDGVKAFVENAEREYRRLAAGTIHGYVERYANGVLEGWARLPGVNRPVDIEVCVDDVIVARARADVFRRDVGHHSYRVPLESLALRSDSQIRVRIAGTGIELENGGRTIADLGRPGI
jgi:hypothetical protein